MIFARIRDLHAPQARFADQPFLDPIAAPVKAGSPTSHYLHRGELEATTPSIIASMTKRSNRMPECSSVTSGMHDSVSINIASGAMKMKYDAAKSTSESTVIQTQLWSRSSLAILLISAPTTRKGPLRSPGRSERSSGPVVSKSLGLSPMKEG